MTSSTPSAKLKRTPLFDVHVRAGAKMVPCGGWEMPVQYAGIIEEHRAVRGAVGLFDISHMGELEVRGPEALAVVQRLTTNAASVLGVGDGARRGRRVAERGRGYRAPGGAGAEGRSPRRTARRSRRDGHRLLPLRAGAGGRSVGPHF